MIEQKRCLDSACFSYLVIGLLAFISILEGEFMNVKRKPIAVVLIRSGSGDLIDKNIKPLAGKPLVFYTLEVALASQLFDEVWVSSDSVAYLELCQQAYPTIRCVHRHKELALVTTSSLETLSDFLQPFADDQVFVNLQVTSPLREVKHLIESYQLYCQSGANHLISCVKADKSRSLYLKMGENSFIDPPKVSKHYARQKEPVYYYPNGSIWISRKDLYLRDETFYTDNTVVYEMPKLYSYDIDDALDFEVLEALLQHHHLGEKIR